MVRSFLKPRAGRTGPARSAKLGVNDGTTYEEEGFGWRWDSKTRDMDRKVLGTLGVAFTLAIAAGGAAVADINADLTPQPSFAVSIDPTPKAQETLASVDAAPAKPLRAAPSNQLHSRHRWVYWRDHHHYVVKKSSKSPTNVVSKAN